VIGLARSDKAAAALTAAGANVHRGDLNDLDRLRDGVTAADGVIHLAFGHDFSDYAGAIEADLRAVEAIGEALKGSGKPFVNVSGTLALTSITPGRLGTEDDFAKDESQASGLNRRMVSEIATIAVADFGVRSSIVRLAPCVHGEWKKGFVGALIDIARGKGVSAYVGDGSNRWPAVHRLDAAHLFCLALEKAPAGSLLHGVADEGVPLRDIAGVIGRHLNLPIASISREEADAHFGFLGAVAALDNPTSSALTQASFGWTPVHPGLISSLEQGHFFND
jgi:nucleoside-diphosphate-sugar epimerase